MRGCGRPGSADRAGAANLTPSDKHHEGAETVADIESARTAFNRYDVDGDGFITAAEYKSVMAQLGDFNVTETVAEALIKQRDDNGDGRLSWDEFWSHLSKA